MLYLAIVHIFICSSLEIHNSYIMSLLTVNIFVITFIHLSFVLLCPKMVSGEC